MYFIENKCVCFVKTVKRFGGAFANSIGEILYLRNQRCFIKCVPVNKPVESGFYEENVLFCRRCKPERRNLYPVK